MPEIKARVLVVEDEAVIALDVARRLNNFGHRVLGPVADAKAALALVRREGPDLALLDINLGQGQDGIELACALQEVVELPVIFLTAHADPDTVKRAKMANPMAYLTKPLNDLAIYSAVEVAIHRYQAERTLRKVQGWFSSAMHSMGDAVLTTDQMDRVTYLNPMACDLLGCEERQLLGRPVTEVLPLLDLERDEAPLEALGAQVEEAGILIGLDRRVGTRSRLGRVFPISYTAAPLHEGERKLGVVVVFRDESCADQTVQDLAQQLRRAQRMEAVGKLASGVAHDFNNMLAVILGFAGLSLDLLPADHPAARYLEAIERSSERAAQLAKQLLAFGRSQVLRPTQVELGQLLGGLTDLLGPALGEGIELELDVADGLWAIHCDPSQLEQVLINLSLNARDAMPSGGAVRFRARNLHANDPLVCMGDVEAPGDYVRLEVSDEGVGITPEHLPRVFEPYFTTKTTGEGTGLGLASAHGTLRQSGALIDVASKVGQGTTFSLYFKRWRRVEGERTSTSQGQERALRRGIGSVLIVNGEELIQGLVSEILARAGYTVVLADYDDAQTLACEHGSDLLGVLYDFAPGPGRVEAAQALQRLLPGLAFVFLVESVAMGEKLRAGPGHHWLVKPFTARALTKTVEGLRTRAEQGEGQLADEL